MAETDSKAYGNEETRWVGCLRFEDLRHRKKLLDLKIVTCERREISAHRIVLAVRFPLIEKALPAEANNCLLWTRFSADIVEAALSYAYTGVVQINSNNALCLFLLAVNLGCEIIMDWCVDFLSSRVNLDNVAEVWAVANSTLHEKLMTLCLPVIRVHFEKLITNSVFSAFMEPKGMAALVADPLVEAKKEGEVEVDILKQWAICCWLDNSCPANASNYRVDQFQRLISYLNMKALPLDILSLLRDMAIELNVLNEHREQITKALKDQRGVLAPPATSSSPSLWRRDLLAYGSFDKSRQKCLLTGIPELESGSDFQFTLPYREGCAVVYIRNWVCVIGGGSPVGSSEVDVLNLDSGELTKGPRMQTARTLHAAVATNSLIFVFGSRNIKKKESNSSCEVWSSLPNMPTASDSSVAVVVPGEGVLVVGGVSNGFRNIDTQLLCGDVEGAVEQEWSWRHLPSMLKARRCPSGAYFKGHVFVAGGNVGGFRDIESLCIPYKENTSPQWTMVTMFPWPSVGPNNLFVFRERMFFIYGNGTVMIYSPARDEVFPRYKKVEKTLRFGVYEMAIYSNPVASKFSRIFNAWERTS
ncbi:Kelch-like protein 7 [Echinococcus granulosus]|uniref:Kelch protein 7 n=1 Tax=Echinococcus granulosus TaxID=6210 RepID=A0A068WDD1_ECHGR|nr:Kelch-like protein 7 [Echinococcus granulosus]CDS18097.1 kelch protein 7 [Echinococcus granulosus]